MTLAFSPMLILFTALVTISALGALVLALAWAELGRPTHAFTWALGFALLAVMWGVELWERLIWGSAGAVGAPMLILAGFASVINTMGFQQRAGAERSRTALLAVACVHAVLVLLLAFLAVPAVARALPTCLLNAAMFWLAAEALHGGRRKGERAAAQAGQAGLFLLSGLNLAFLIGIMAALSGKIVLNLSVLGALTVVLMPAVVTCLGLLTVILLTADLADQARRLAATDMLTGLLNRRGFEEAARAQIQLAAREARQLALVLMDIDLFKDVNDRFGHPAGDRVLRLLACEVSSSIGPADIFARIGGEEFALIMPDALLERAAAAAEALRAQVAATDMRLAASHRVTVSFGVVALSKGQPDLSALLRRADAALYRAKDSGRNRVAVG